MVEKRNIFLIGPMGAGKSTIGRQLAQQLNMQFFDSDQEIERRTGADISWVFDVEGEEGFRIREEKIISELTEKQGIVLATGGGSVKSREIRNRLSARGVVVYLKTTVDNQLSRTQRDKKRPLLLGEFPPVKILQNLASERNPLYEEIADITICTDNQNAKVVVNKILFMLKKN
ncbi:MAG: shikimate kinase AroK [Candidatus Dasytiphilus stammeri]